MSDADRIRNPLIDAQEGAEVIAHLVATFYRTLIANGMPETLARRLTYKYHDALMYKFYFAGGRA